MVNSCISDMSYIAHTGTGCPGRLWSLLLWRYSRPAWTRSSAVCCRQEGWTRWPTEVPSNPYHSVILWFCDSVILWFCSYKWNTRVCVCQVCKVFTVNITNCGFCEKCHKGEESYYLQGSISLKHFVCSVQLQLRLRHIPFVGWGREGKRRKDGAK